MVIWTKEDYEKFGGGGVGHDNLQAGDGTIDIKSNLVVSGNLFVLGSSSFAATGSTLQLANGPMSASVGTGGHLFELSSVSGSVKAFVDLLGNASFNSMYVGMGSNSKRANVAIGYNVLSSPALGTGGNGTGNIAIGSGSMLSGNNIFQNYAIGESSMRDIANARDNVGIGVATLMSNRSGSYNVAIGSFASYLISGSFNTCVGVYAGYNPSGDYNTAMGVYALAQGTKADMNSAFGLEALRYVSGSKNIGIGVAAGKFVNGGAQLTASHSSTFIGYGTRASGNDQYNQIVIGYSSIGSGSNTTVIGNNTTTATYLGGALKLSQVVNLLSYSNPTPTDGDIWLSGTDVLVRITGSTYKMSLVAYP